MIKENKLLLDFKLPSSNKKEFHLSKFLKQDLILYIYPKNNTPGCTSESIDFAKNYKKFKKLKVNVIGISKDSLDSHIEFKKKFKLPFQLLSDVSFKVIKKLGAWGIKSMYGRKFEGTKRTTILIKKNRKIIKIWKNVKVNNHVDDVLNFIKKNKI